MARIVSPSLQADIADRIPNEAVRGLSRDAIARAVTAIAERYQPERIVLFGSRAMGTARPTSDVDLLVVMDRPGAGPGERTGRAEEIRAALRSAGVERVHPTVRTPQKICVGVAEGDFFVQDMLQGIVLFETERSGGDDNRVADGEGPAKRPGELKQATQGWLATADLDYRSAQRLGEPPDPIPESVCFHAQQTVEKVLKALLQEQGIPFPRTHDRNALGRLAGSALPHIETRSSDLVWLSDFAVSIRYPDIDAAPPDSERALRIATDLRTLVRTALGLGEGKPDDAAIA